MKIADKNHPAPFFFGPYILRVTTDDCGEYWFVAKDVCRILEIEKYRDAISVLDDDERGSEIVDTPGGPQTMATISESGLYALVFRSRKPEAKRFSRWVRSEVLPAIRRTGRYEKCKQIGATPIPANIIEVSLGLKPSMRQRLWRDALDTARMDGGGIDLACRCFESLCAMMSAQCILPDAGALILRFMDERLRECANFSTPFGKIEKTFLEWWQKYGNGAAPGSKMLASYLRTRFAAYKSSVMIYRSCRIIEQA